MLVASFRESLRPEEGQGFGEGDLGWNECARELGKIFVPGDHLTMVAEPHVKTLAERLGAVLLGNRIEF